MKLASPTVYADFSWEQRQSRFASRAWHIVGFRYRHGYSLSQVFACILFISLWTIPVASFTAAACDVPVFGYALQHWEPDPYRVYVFFHDTLSDAEQRVVDALREAAESEERKSNLVVITVDLHGSPAPDLLRLRELHLPDKSSGVVVLFPAITRIPAPVYVGDITASLPSHLLTSPARETLIANLLEEHAAVWAFIEGADRRASDAARELLTRELERLARVLSARRSAVDASNPAELPVTRFSLVTLSRDDPEEAFLVDMLLNSEPDLQEQTDAPMVFPIYGRGLALYALVGAGINEYTIADACDFLTGPCTCNIKASNPGTDLLLSVSWERFIGPDRFTALPPMIGLAGFIDRGHEAASVMDDADRAALNRLERDIGEDAPRRAGSPPALVALLLALLMGAIFAGSYYLFIHRR